MNKNILLTIAIVIALVLGFVGATKKPEIKTSSVASPDIPSAYMSFGGVRMWAYTQSMSSATSSTCAIQSPLATTTLASATAVFSSSPSYSVGFQFGNATTPFATTTTLGARVDLVAGASGIIVASSTPSTGAPIISPGTWINLRLSTSTGSTVGSSMQVTGTCAVRFIEAML